MSYAEFAPVTQDVNKKQPIILDVPKVVAPAPAPTTVHVSYPFKLNKKDESNWTWSWSFLALFILVWIIAGFMAFVMSLVCFARDGTVIEKIVGLLLPFLIGPFYWMYFFMSKTYCKSA
jgi:heme/copper-type cytochrome/quinol oxidase subunit 4